MKKKEHCIGRYYNFKKGFEVCQYRDSCPHYKHYQFLEGVNAPTYEMPRIRHGNIREFRKCKRFNTTELLTNK